MIKDEGVRAYADKLEAAGFAIYEPPGRGWSFFIYSREVDGVELFGIVQAGDFPSLGQPLEHTMPIKPSRENGSAMWIDAAVPPDSVEYAELVTRPTNHNRLVGTQKNYLDPRKLEHYAKR